MSARRAWWRSPVGQVASVVVVFVLAAVVAAAIASQRTFFESTVRLKPTHIDVAGAGVVAATRGDSMALRARPLFDNAWDTFIGDTAVDDVATALFVADADEALRRLRLTLVAGNAAQRARAVQFVVVVHDPRADTVLAEARAWWARRRATVVVSALSP